MMVGEPMTLPRCAFSELSMDQKVALADEWKQQVRYLIDQAKELIV